MNPIAALFYGFRYTNQLNAHVKKVLAAVSSNARSLESPQFEGFLDWIETNPSVRWVMVGEFDPQRPYTRDDLKNIGADLMAGNLGLKDVMRTFASRSALVYLARARRRGEDHGLICFALKEHWQSGSSLPIEPALFGPNGATTVGR